jgi:hypothetical protein
MTGLSSGLLFWQDFRFVRVTATDTYMRGWWLSLMCTWGTTCWRIENPNYWELLLHHYQCHNTEHQSEVRPGYEQTVAGTSESAKCWNILLNPLVSINLHLSVNKNVWIHTVNISTFCNSAFKFQTCICLLLGYPVCCAGFGYSLKIMWAYAH